MRFIVSLMLAAGSYFAMRHFLSQKLFVSILVSAVIFVLLFRGMKKLLAKIAQKGQEENLAPDHEKVISEGLEKIYHIRNSTYLIRDSGVAEEVAAICSVGLDIFAELKKEPEEIRKSRQFLKYYLDSTVTILDRYAELSRRKDKTPEMLESIAKVEKMLPDVKETFRRQLAALLENDLLDLNVEISLLDKTMKMDG